MATSLAQQRVQRATGAEDRRLGGKHDGADAVAIDCAKRTPLRRQGSYSAPETARFGAPGRCQPQDADPVDDARPSPDPGYQRWGWRGLSGSPGRMPLRRCRARTARGRRSACGRVIGRHDRRIQRLVAVDESAEQPARAPSGSPSRKSPSRSGLRVKRSACIRHGFIEAQLDTRIDRSPRSPRPQCQKTAGRAVRTPGCRRKKPTW